jgi:O-antigen ligase
VSVWRLPTPILGALLIGAASDLPGRIVVGGVTGGAFMTAVVTLGSLVLLPRILRARASLLNPLLPLWAFMGWVAIEAAFNGLPFDGVQNVLVFLLFVSVLTVTTVYGPPHAATINRWMLRIGWLVAGLYAVSILLDGIGANSVLGRRSFGLEALLFMAITVPMPRPKGLARWMPWVLFVLVAGSLSRTALVAAGVMLVARAAHGRTRRHLARPIAAALVGALVLAWGIGNVPALHDRFYGGDHGISLGGITLNINGEGRTEIYEDLTDDIHLNHLAGFGPGAASTHLKEGTTGASEPHNDFLRVIYDYGWVGLALLLWAGARLLRATVGGARRAPSIADAAPHTTAALVIIAVASGMVTDNVLIYDFVTAPAAVLIGLSLGVLGRNEPVARPRATQTHSKLG